MATPLTLYTFLFFILPLLLGWGADRIWADPAGLPHPIVGFGKMISFCQHRFNHGSHREIAGAVTAASLITLVFLATELLLLISFLIPPMFIIVSAILIFYCLAGTTLIREVKMVFEAVDRSVDEGRRQLSRIVGRDTANLSADEIRRAALETLAENLSDGVIAPLFWLGILGVPGMMAYKMVNTLDSMIGYKTERYREFGFAAAKIDDFLNYIPARLTALIMILMAGKGFNQRLEFVKRFGRSHASPNSGYPEAALASILDCRFGGTHDYFGHPVYKPYIGVNPRPISDSDLRPALSINRMTESTGVAVAAILTLFRVALLGF